MKLTTTDTDKFNLECDKQELLQLLDLVQIAMTTTYLHQELVPAATEIESLLRKAMEKTPSPATEESLSFNRTTIQTIKEEYQLDNEYKIRSIQPTIYLDKNKELFEINRPLLDIE